MAGSLNAFVTRCIGPVLLAGAALGVTYAATEPGASREPLRPLRLLVLDVELAGDLGGPGLSAEHETRLQWRVGGCGASSRAADCFRSWTILRCVTPSASSGRNSACSMNAMAAISKSDAVPERIA